MRSSEDRMVVIPPDGGQSQMTHGSEPLRMERGRREVGSKGETKKGRSKEEGGKEDGRAREAGSESCRFTRHTGSEADE